MEPDLHPHTPSRHEAHGIYDISCPYTAGPPSTLVVQQWNCDLTQALPTPGCPLCRFALGHVTWSRGHVLRSVAAHHVGCILDRGVVPCCLRSAWPHIQLLRT